MANPSVQYTQGNILNEMNIADLVRNTKVAGVILQGQHELALNRLIDETNLEFSSQGTGNIVNDTYKTEIAYKGDPSIRQISASATNESGGIVKINWGSPYAGFRKDDTIDKKLHGQQYKIVDADANYIRIGAIEGGVAPTASDFANGVQVNQRTRSINMTGTKSPVGLNTVPNRIQNYFSILDDANQANIWMKQNRTVLEDSPNYFSDNGIREMMGRFYRNMAFSYLTDRGVNPETNGMTFSRMRGIFQQVEEAGSLFAYNTTISKQEFIQKVRKWYIDNPASDISRKVILTGSIGFQLVSDWFQELIKYDSTISLSFTGEANGLNAVRIYIPGFESYIQIVRWGLLDMDTMGTLTGLPNFGGIPQTSGNFYCFDFTPTTTESGLRGPAFQKVFYRERFYYSYQQGLRATGSFDSALANKTPMTLENMANTSTDYDFDNFRIATAHLLNVMNPASHLIITNNV
jgi:hypothetical protein